ncbi:MAG TPA: hypothetical protein VII22_23075 [Streptosporangiaceae bacterium]
MFFGAAVVTEQDIAACGAAQTFGVIEYEMVFGVGWERYATEHLGAGGLHVRA